MDIVTIQPVQGPAHLQQILQSTLPHYRVEAQAGGVVVSNGVCTGLHLKQSGPQMVKSGWVIPNVAVRLLWSLGMVLTGILPGLLVYGLIYLGVKSGVAQMEQDVMTILRGGSVSARVAGAGGGAAMGPARPSAPGAGLLVAAILGALIGLSSVGFGYEDFERASDAQSTARRMRLSAALSRSSYSNGTPYYSYYSSPEYEERRAKDHIVSGGVKLTFGFVLCACAVGALALRSAQRKKFFALNPALATA